MALVQGPALELAAGEKVVRVVCHVGVAQPTHRRKRGRARGEAATHAHGHLKLAIRHAHRLADVREPPGCPLELAAADTGEHGVVCGAERIGADGAEDVARGAVLEVTEGGPSAER